MLQFIFHYPEMNGINGDTLDAGPLHEIASAAERYGFDGMSFSEHPAPGAKWLMSGGHQTLDPFVALGYVAAATRRLRLLTYVSVAPYRNPFLLAKAAATLDKLSDGRFILGLGAGYQKSEFHALGVDMEERNALFDETLDVLPLHWRGDPFSYQGRHFNARDVIARPLPVQNPIPIWIGGDSRLSRQRAALKGQGWMTMAGGPTVSATARTPDLSALDLAGAIADMRRDAAVAGRSEKIDVLHSYSGAQADNDHDRHREALAKLEQAGVTWVMVTCHTRERSATLDFIEAFGTNYLQ